MASINITVDRNGRITGDRDAMLARIRYRFRVNNSQASSLLDEACEWLGGDLDDVGEINFGVIIQVIKSIRSVRASCGRE